MKREVITPDMDKVVDLQDFKRKGLTFGGDGGDENWLKNIPIGDVILCKRQNVPKDILALDLFFVVEHKDRVTNVIQKVPTGQQADMWVDTLEFSRYYRYKETIANVKLGYEDQAETSETTDNGNSEGSLRPSGLRDDEEPQG